MTIEREDPAMPARRGRPPGPSRGRLLAVLAGSPWLSSDEAAALTGVAPRSVRAYLRPASPTARLLRRWASAAPWPPTALYAVAPADGSLPAPRRLARPEHTRALHALLVALAAAARRRLDGRPQRRGGRAAAGRRRPPAGRPGRRLARPARPRARPAGALGPGRRDRRRPRGAGSTALLDLGGDAPPLLVVCADDWARQEWPQRLLNRGGRPDLRLCLAADLAAGRPDWRDAWDRPAALPVAGAPAPELAGHARRPPPGRRRPPPSAAACA